MEEISASSQSQQPQEMEAVSQGPESPAERGQSGVDLVTDIENFTVPSTQSRPSEFSNLAAEIVFILVCSVGPLLFALFNGHIEVNQEVLVRTFDIPDSTTPWLIGSYLLANGVSVSVCGSLVDLVPLRTFMFAAFSWMTIWNIVGAVTVTITSRWVLFNIVRTM